MRGRGAVSVDLDLGKREDDGSGLRDFGSSLVLLIYYFASCGLA